MANNRELSQFASTVGYSGGNIGIGSAIPTDILDIQTGSSDEVTKFKVKTAGQFEITRNHADAPYIKTLMTSGNPNIILGDSAGDKVLINGDGFSYFNGGNIGINDTGPNFHLDVNGNIAIREGQVLAWHDGSGNKAGDIYMDSSDNFVIRNTSSVAERLRIKSDGQLLHTRSDDTTRYDLEFRQTGGISDGNYSGIHWTQGSTGSTNLAAIEIEYANNGRPDIIFKTRQSSGTAMSEAARISSGGNVGINTDNPTTKLEIGDSHYGSNLTGSVGFQLASQNATDTTGVAFNMVQREGYRWIQYHGSTTSWIGTGNLGFVWNDGVTESTGLSVGITTEGYIVGNRNVVQVIDATTATRFNGTGTNTVITSSAIKCNSNKSRFMIHVHCPVNTSDDSDAGNANMNPYFAGYVQRNLNGAGWTDCGGKGSSSQGGHSAHIELSPNRTGSNGTTDYFSGNRYRLEHKYVHFFDDELSPGANNTIQFRLRVVNHGGGNWIQIGEPQGYGTDDNYPCQRWGMMIYELGPDTRFTVQNKAP